MSLIYSYFTFLFCLFSSRFPFHLLSPDRTNVKTKFAQYHAFEDEETRISIARKFIEAKFDKSQVVLDYLKQRYPEVNYDFSKDKEKLKSAKTVREIMVLRAVLPGNTGMSFQKQFLRNMISVPG